MSQEEPNSQESIKSQTSETDELKKPMENLAVESPVKESKTRKRPRGSGALESPAKLSRSASTSSLLPRGRGRPKGKSRLSDISKLRTPPCPAITLSSYPNGGVLMAFGMGDAGQLGMGEDIMERKKPQPVKEVEGDVVCAAAGGMHNVYVNNEGNVYTFGCNDEGALGRKIEEEEESFNVGKVDGVGKAVYCCAGDSHSAVINEAGEVWIWGTFRDANGRLGAGTGAKENTNIEKAVLKEPAKLELSTKALRIASGADHMLILDNDGEVWSLGCAETGQLGRLSQQFCTKGGRRGAGKVLNPEKLALRRLTRKVGKIIDVACGQFSSFLITENGKIIGFGLNNCFQLGFSDREIRYQPEIVPFKFEGEVQNAKQISSGMHHTLVLSDQGEVFSIGCGDYGRLGVGEKDSIRESSVWRKVSLDQKVLRIGTGSCTSYAIMEDGSARAWGMGNNLQLTTGEEDDEWEPVNVQGKKLEGMKVLRIHGGGQHAVLIAAKKEEEEVVQNGQAA